MLQSFRASLVSLRGPLLLTLAAWSAGCTGAFSNDDRDVSLEDSLLGGMAGSPSTPACSATDTADTTCDDLDDDCDGDLDEDCDFDPASCPAGYRRIVGTAGDDTLVGTLHRDCIVGYGGDDAIYGLGNDDLLVGGPGDDVIQGGTGDDKIRGGDGADQIEGGFGKDNIEGGAGNDVIDAGSGNDEVQGGMCHDRIAGGLGRDDLRGNDGSDRITSARIYNRVDGGNGTDACSGTSCEVSLFASQCTSDAQCPASKRCVIATGICVPAGSVAFTDETCDGVDEDCDGRTDEEFSSTSTTCGVGACQSSGSVTCEDGELVNDSCTPGTPAANDASCNAIDDDCNGHSDEDFMSQPTSCGTGACQRSGTTSCTAGSVSDNCMPGAPASDANCNGSDNDCDGATDEHFVSESTTCGVGACAATGSTSCVGGMMQNSCTPGAAGPDTSCDGVDQDCDAHNDEHYVPQPISCGVGACAATGSTSCVGGMVQNSCTPGTPEGNDSNCDGIDDDCDGQADEGFGSQPSECGVGACHATGSKTCVGGMVQDSCMAGTPAADDASCNGTDDDCDGQTDEDFGSQPSECGVGECHATGNRTCVGGTVQDSCMAGAPAADDATCDGLDDDCDEQTDEDFVSMMTTCGFGVCAGAGATICVDGQVEDSCEQGTPGEHDASCNGADEDCNGAVDEDFQPSCMGSTSVTCVGGQVQNFECSDGTLCNGAETCSAGVCMPGVPDEPTDDGDPCTTDSCDSATGEVTHTPVPSGTSCSDGEVCNGEELCLGGGGTPGCATVPSGGVAWWRAEDNADDSIGPHHGTLFGGVPYATGHVGQAFNFDGNDRVNLNAHAAALALTTGAATLEFWMKTNSTLCQTVFNLRLDDDNEQVFQVGDCVPLGSEVLTWRRTVGANNSTVTFTPGGGTGPIDNTWHHVAVTLSGPATPTNPVPTTQIYVDGLSVAAGGNGLWGGFAPTIATLGAHETSPTRRDATMRGPLDEVTLYDRALTAAEINAIRMADMAGKCTGSGGPITCTDGMDAPNGTMCENGGECDGLGNCSQ